MSLIYRLRYTKLNLPCFLRKILRMITHGFFLHFLLPFQGIFLLGRGFYLWNVCLLGRSFCLWSSLRFLLIVKCTSKSKEEGDSHDYTEDGEGIPQEAVDFGAKFFRFVAYFFFQAHDAVIL